MLSDAKYGRSNLTHDAESGAANLLFGCAGCVPGQRILIVHEPDFLAYYDPMLPQALLRVARRNGLSADLFECPYPLSKATVEFQALIRSMQTHDRTVFLSRLGDQMRFDRQLKPGSSLVCYALNQEMLASEFGRTPYASMLALRALINETIGGTDDLRIKCPLGTDLTGFAPALSANGDTSTIRFPLSVFTPVPAQSLNGKIAQTGFLVGTGSRYYEPYCVALDDVLIINVEQGRIVGFSGSDHDVQTAQRHYHRVAAQFDIDPWCIHSWHAGIHAGCAFHDAAGADPLRWGGGAFGNPRLLHFHTCGDYPPGEISLNIVDPTVTVNGIALWDQGCLRPERVSGGEALLAQHPQLRTLLETPARQIGLADNGRLSFHPATPPI